MSLGRSCTGRRVTRFMPPKMAAAWRQGEYEEGETPLVVSEKRTATSNSRTVPSSPWRRPDQTFRGKKRGMRPYSDTLFDRYTSQAWQRGQLPEGPLRRPAWEDPGQPGRYPGLEDQGHPAYLPEEGAQPVPDPGLRQEGGPGPRGAVQWRVRPVLTLELVRRFPQLFARP